MGLPNETLNPSSLTETAKYAPQLRERGMMTPVRFRQHPPARSSRPKHGSTRAQLKRMCADYCAICRMYTGTVQGLVSHYLRYHYNFHKPLNYQDGQILPMVYICMRCQTQIFESKINFRQHLVNAHGDLYQRWCRVGKRPDGYYVGYVRISRNGAPQRA